MIKSCLRCVLKNYEHATLESSIAIVMRSLFDKPAAYKAEAIAKQEQGL
jgi:hypothetical protein